MILTATVVMYGVMFVSSYEWSANVAIVVASGRLGVNDVRVCQLAVEISEAQRLGGRA